MHFEATERICGVKSFAPLTTISLLSSVLMNQEKMVEAEQMSRQAVNNGECQDSKHYPFSAR